MTQSVLPSALSRVILASGSQTRADMLRNAGLDFTVQPASVDEDEIKQSLITEGISPHEIAEVLAELKARAVSSSQPDALVIGADQLLVKDGHVFSKATNRGDAEITLAAFSGGEHTLISAIVIYQNGQAIWRVFDQAKLTVRPLSETFIQRYLDALADDAYWSVGCYQLEGLGSQLFTKIEGDYFTVLGLPLFPLLDFLRRHGHMPI